MFKVGDKVANTINNKLGIITEIHSKSRWINYIDVLFEGSVNVSFENDKTIRKLTKLEQALK